MLIRHFEIFSILMVGVLQISCSLAIRAQTGLVLPYLQNATPQRMVIMWETNVNTGTVIEYGMTPDLGSTVTGTAITTTAGTILHTAVIDQLSPATRYYYKAITGSWQSAVYDFVTPPLSTSEQGFNIVLMSDMQKDGGNPAIFANLINTSLLPYIADAYGTPLSDHLQMAVLPGDVVDNGNNYNQYKNDFSIRDRPCGALSLPTLQSVITKLIRSIILIISISLPTAHPVI